jgi:hypothetical protein
VLTAIVQDVAGIQGFERLAKEAGRTEDIPEIGGATSVGESYEYETYRQRQIRWWARRYGNPVGDLIAVGIGSVEHRLRYDEGLSDHGSRSHGQCVLLAQFVRDVSGRPHFDQVIG